MTQLTTWTTRGNIFQVQDGVSYFVSLTPEMSWTGNRVHKFQSERLYGNSLKSSPMSYINVEPQPSFVGKIAVRIGAKFPNATRQCDFKL